MKCDERLKFSLRRNLNVTSFFHTSGPVIKNPFVFGVANKLAAKNVSATISSVQNCCDHSQSKNSFSFLKFLLIRNLWDITHSPSFSPLQSCLSKFRAWCCNACNFDKRAGEGEGKGKVMETSLKHSVSQAFLQLVVACNYFWLHGKQSQQVQKQLITFLEVRDSLFSPLASPLSHTHPATSRDTKGIQKNGGCCFPKQNNFQPSCPSKNWLWLWLWFWFSLFSIVNFHVLSVVGVSRTMFRFKASSVIPFACRPLAFPFLRPPSHNVFFYLIKSANLNKASHGSDWECWYKRKRKRKRAVTEERYWDPHGWLVWLTSPESVIMWSPFTYIASMICF